MSEVVWKILGDAVDIYSGEQLNKDDMKKTGQYPVMNGGTSFSGYTDGYNEERNTVTISQGGASAGFVNWLDTEFWLGAHCYAVKPKKNVELSKRFLYHFLKDNEYALMQKKQGAGIPGLNRSSISNILFHYISPENQRDVVNHLDTFTSLISRLEGELQLRQKQYEHYREELLNFEGDEEVEWKTLGDICNIMNGKDYKKEGHGEVPVYGSGGIMTYIDKAMSSKPSVLLPRKGSLNNVFYVDTPFWTVDTIYWTDIKDNTVPKYFYYYMTTINLEAMNIATGAVPSMTKAILNKIVIPVPKDPHRQKQIVDKLDMFEQLIAALKREIALRKKQYTYYREKLLTFE